MNEIWKESVGGYWVSNLGRVKSPERIDRSGHKRNERTIKTYVTTFGYERVNLYVSGRRRNCFVHRLVAGAFLRNDKNLSQVNHIDGNKLNNCVDNLEWVTQSENEKHAYRNGLKVPKYNCETTSKRIEQYSLSGELIKTYLSSKEVERETGYFGSNVRTCCRGKQKTAYGYIWKFA